MGVCQYYSDNDSGTNIPSEMYYATPCIDYIWLMLTNELFRPETLVNPWGPIQYVSYGLMDGGPFLRGHTNINEWVVYLKRQVQLGTDELWDIEIPYWSQAESDRCGIASYSWGFAIIYSDNDTGTKIPNNLHEGTSTIDYLWIMLTNELFTPGSNYYDSGPNQYVSYNLLSAFPQYSFHNYMNTKEGVAIFKRDVIPGSDSKFDIEMYGWNETVWNEINIASYSGGFAK